MVETICNTYHGFGDIGKATLKMTAQKMGFNLVTLTNRSNKVVNDQMNYAELKKYFDHLFSVEDVKSFKPQAEAYQYVLNILNLKLKMS
jgi:2-haloacid dehalogenase